MRLKNYLQRLDEKLIVINGTQGKNYGNVVILAGGGGSGKGFALSNFMEANLFKVRDIDEVKRLFLKLDELKKKFPEIRGLDLRRPADVGKLHMFIKNKGIKEKTWENFMKGVKPGRLPNVVFDITFRDIKAANFHWIEKMINELGYDPKDVNLVWVLTDYALAVQQNRERDRIVPDDIMLGTHEGAALNMINVIMGRVPQTNNKKLFDGAIHVILNNRENTLYWLGPKQTTNDIKKAIKTKVSKEDYELYKATKGKEGKKPEAVIAGFKYITLKEKGKPIKKDKDVRKEIFDWIKKNAPKTLDVDVAIATGEKDTTNVIPFTPKAKMSGENPYPKQKRKIA